MQANEATYDAGVGFTNDLTMILRSFCIFFSIIFKIPGNCALTKLTYDDLTIGKKS